MKVKFYLRKGLVRTGISIILSGLLALSYTVFLWSRIIRSHSPAGRQELAHDPIGGMIQTQKDLPPVGFYCISVANKSKLFRITRRYALQAIALAKACSS